MNAAVPDVRARASRGAFIDGVYGSVAGTCARLHKVAPIGTAAEQ